jgi:hypothetical protein
MKHIFIYVLLALLLFSCAKDQPQVAWLKIDQWDLVSNPDAQSAQGELSHDISQVFVNMDGKSLGVYELPAKIPIIGEGTHDFVLIPGVINNGISATKKRYPFLEQYKGTLTLKQNDTISLIPQTRYYASINFLIEDFESPSLQLDVSTESSATLGRNNDPNILVWGNKYGEVLLNDADSLISFVTNFQTVLPKLGSEVYLEFDYMNTNSLLTSLISYGNGNYYEDPYVQINPQQAANAVWKHVYIDLKENISFRQTTPINEAQFTILLDEMGTSKYFYIDNIKLIYP